MTQGTLQGFSNGGSYTTAENLKYSFPHTAGLTGLGVLPLADVNGNVLTGSGAVKRMLTNFAPNAAQACSVIGSSPVQQPIYTSFTHTAHLDSLLPETPSFSFMAIVRSSATLVSPDIAPIIGNYNSSTTSSSQLAYASGAGAPAGNFKITASTLSAAPVASFTGGISSGVLTVSAVTSGTIISTGTNHVIDTGSLIPVDVLITGQLSGTTGGIGTYSVNVSTLSVPAGTALSTYTSTLSGLSLAVADCTAWRLVCGRVQAGVGAYLNDLTAGTSATATGTFANQRNRPNPTNTQRIFGSISTAYQGACDGIAWASANVCWTDAVMNDNAAQMRKYATNRGITV